jgi:anti-anti-sigma factor
VSRRSAEPEEDTMDTLSGPPHPPELRHRRTDRPDGTTCLVVSGDIDMSTGEEFRRTVMQIVADPAARALFIDLADLRFIDSNGITVLVKAQRAADERGLRLAVVNVDPDIRGLLEMLGVYDMLAGRRGPAF